MSKEFVMVPRGLLERYVSSVESHNYVFVGDEEIRALLDKPAGQHQGEPVALPARKNANSGHDTEDSYGDGWDDCLCEIAKLGPLYTHADPGEVEQLRAELAERNTDLEFWKRSCRTWESVAKKQNDRLFDVLQAILNGSKLSYHPWPVDGAEFEPLEASNPVYLVGGKDGAIAIRPYAEPVSTSSATSAPFEMDGLTFDNRPIRSGYTLGSGAESVGVLQQRNLLVEYHAEIQDLHSKLGAEVSKRRAMEAMAEARGVHRDTIRMQLGEMATLLCEVRDSFGPSWRDIKYADRVDAALSASAEPSAPVEIDERAAFEKEFAAKGRPLTRADYDPDAYGNAFDDGAWTGWRARASMEPPK